MDSHSHSHEGAIKTYVITYLFLMVLLVVTVALAYIHFGVLNTPIAMVVATVKAAMVVYFFMHMKGASPMVIASLGSGIFMMIIAFLLMFSDFAAR